VTPGRRERGQSLVEFGLILPALMILLLGLVEFGFIFSNHQGLEYATREGARTAAALANGQNGQNGVPAATTCTTIDNQVIAAVQRVLTGKGSMVQVGDVSQIRIFKYDDTTQGPVALATNVWVPGAGPTVDGTVLQFRWSSGTWDPCIRDNGMNADVIGVRLTYTYRMTTGLNALLGVAGLNTLQMTDETVMVLNP
jgi:hypothetical protein